MKDWAFHSVKVADILADRQGFNQRLDSLESALKPQEAALDCDNCSAHNTEDCDHDNPEKCEDGQIPKPMREAAPYNGAIAQVEFHDHSLTPSEVVAKVLPSLLAKGEVKPKRHLEADRKEGERIAALPVVTIDTKGKEVHEILSEAMTEMDKLKKEQASGTAEETAHIGEALTCIQARNKSCRFPYMALPCLCVTLELDQPPAPAEKPPTRPAKPEPFLSSENANEVDPQAEKPQPVAQVDKTVLTPAETRDIFNAHDPPYTEFLMPLEKANQIQARHTWPIAFAAGEQKALKAVGERLWNILQISPKNALAFAEQLKAGKPLEGMK